MTQSVISFISKEVNTVVVAGKVVELAAPGDYSAKSLPLTTTLKKQLPHYLDNYDMYSSSWGEIKLDNPVLAFSYGAGPEVNALLAQEVVALLDQGVIHAIVQWEIADIVSALAPELAERLSAIRLSAGESYMSTAEVASKALTMTTLRQVTIVAQAWHITRCIRQSSPLGWQCAATRAINEFAPSDPQPWVRHPLDWIVKESRMRYQECTDSMGKVCACTQ
ncbi:hypothetical protein [Thaumasiovibrio sp. DFM-14]|uniref:hypothetical protein n=1 Tax=Thaumasiovibrio sp. DFM-14 TaxID=3384792 RepID=UPI0039A2EE36